MAMIIVRKEYMYMSYKIHSRPAQLSLFDNRDNKNVLLLLPTPARTNVHPRDRIFKKNIFRKKSRPTK